MTKYFTITDRDDRGGAKPTDSETVTSLRRAMVGTEGPVSALPLLWRQTADHTDDWISAFGLGMLVSDAFKAVIDRNRGPDDVIQWIPSHVERADGTQGSYWVPDFPIWRDLLDQDISTYGPSGYPIRWVLSAEKMRGIRVARRPSTIGDLIVDDTIMRELRHERLTGFTATPSRIDMEK